MTNGFYYEFTMNKNTTVKHSTGVVLIQYRLQCSFKVQQVKLYCQANTIKCLKSFISDEVMTQKVTKGSWQHGSMELKNFNTVLC